MLCCLNFSLVYARKTNEKIIARQIRSWRNICGRIRRTMVFANLNRCAECAAAQTPTIFAGASFRTKFLHYTIDNTMNTENPFAYPSPESAPPSLAAGIESRRGSTCHLASLAVVAMFSLLRPDVAVAAIAPPLGAATSFAVLAATPNVNNTGPTAITGDIGVSPAAAIIGFPPGTIIGTLHTADAFAASAQVDNTSAYAFLAGQACDTTFAGPTDLAGLTLVPGVRCFATSAANSGSLTLNAGGNANAVWIFRTASTLITGSGSSVVLTNGAQACNVFWQVGSSATLGTTTTFVGNILALTSITLQTGASLSGRALAQTGTVTLASNNVSLCTLAPPPPPPPAPPTLAKAFSPASINAGAISTLTITLSNANATVATLSAPLVDSLPAGLVVAPTPNASTTCGGGTSVTATAGGNTVTLPSGRSIPASGSCTVSVDVTAALAGSYVNTLLVGALQTSNGNNPAAAVATLTTVSVLPPPPIIAPSVGIPALSVWVLFILTSLLAVIGFTAIRRQVR